MYTRLAQVLAVVVVLSLFTGLYAEEHKTLIIEAEDGQGWKERTYLDEIAVYPPDNHTFHEMKVEIPSPAHYTLWMHARHLGGYTIYFADEENIVDIGYPGWEGFKGNHNTYQWYKVGSWFLKKGTKTIKVKSIHKVSYGVQIIDKFVLTTDPKFKGVAKRSMKERPIEKRSDLQKKSGEQLIKEMKKSGTFGALVFPACLEGNHYWLAQDIPQVLRFYTVNPNPIRPKNIIFYMDTPAGFEIVNAIEAVKYTNPIRKWIIKKKKGRDIYSIKLQGVHILQMMVKANSKVLKQGDYEIKFWYQYDTKKSDEQKLDLTVLPPIPKVKTPEGCYLGVFYQWWWWPKIPKQVKATMFDSLKKAGINTIFVDKNYITDDLVPLCKERNIHIFVYPFWEGWCLLKKYQDKYPQSKAQDPGGKEVKTHGGNIRTCPQYLINEKPGAKETLEETIAYYANKGMNIYIDWECPPGCYDNRCKEAFLKRNTEIKDITWPDDVLKGGKYYEKWVDFSIDQRALLLARIRKEVDKHPGMLIGSYCGWPPVEDWARKHYRYGYCADLKKEAKYIDILAPGGYIPFVDQLRCWMEGISKAPYLTEGKKFIPFLSANPGFNEKPTVPAHIFHLEAGLAVANKASGIFAYNQLGVNDGRRLHTFARTNLALQGKDVIAQGEECSQLIKCEFEGYIYAYKTEKEMVIGFIQKPNKEKWSGKITINDNTWEGSKVKDLTESKDLGVIKDSRFEIEIERNDFNFIMIDKT